MPSARAVIQYSRNGKTKIAEYSSGHEAAAATGAKQSSISKACQGVMARTAGGYQWRYKKELKTPKKAEKTGQAANFDNTSYCPCDICNNSEGCQCECSLFQAYVSGVYEKKRKAAYYAKKQLQEMCSQLLGG